MSRGWHGIRLAFRTTLIASCLTASPLWATDEFIAGYASAVLESDFELTGATVTTKDGIVTVTTTTLGQIDRAKLIAALERIPGVVRVELLEGDPPIAGTPPKESATPSSAWLPHHPLFNPIHADPRWPQFGAAYRQFGHGLNLSGTFAANFGETFSIYRHKAWFGGEWDVGIQAGVFSIFDISSASIDLVNADYRVGLLSSYRNGRLSAFFRVQHQSSHLGDEFLLTNPQVTRVNLSYEELDVKVSYEVFTWLRLYGGGGFIVHRQPDTLGRGTTQWGVELTGTRAYVGGRLRPVAYADFQSNERTQWSLGRSIRAGVQLENARIGDRRIQVMAEYYEGPSPDGQFYVQQTGWYGVGLYFFF